MIFNNKDVIFAAIILTQKTEKVKIIGFFSLLIFFFNSLTAVGQFDLTVTAGGVTSPTDGCYLSASELVTVVVVNNQVTPYSGTFDITYTLNAGTPVVETVTTAMPGNGTYNYSFVVNADMSACQVHTLDISVYDVNDINNTNDSISISVTSDCAPVTGAISGPDTLCSGINIDSLELIGYTGIITDWENSLDGSTWTSLTNSNDVEYINNLVPETYYQVIVASLYGYCPSDTTSIDTVAVFQQSDAGVLPADIDICDNGNWGAIDVTGFIGGIVDWQESSDNGASWTNLGDVNDTITYSGLTDTMMYQVIVQNGSCPADTSAPITLTLIPGSDAGTIIGESLVCNFANDSSLLVTGVNGIVTAWFYSTDSGATWLPSTQTDSVFTYSNLQGNTMFQAEVTLGSCPPDYSTHFITVLPLNISATATPNPINEGDTTLLNSTGGVSYLWFPNTFLSSDTGPNPEAWPETDITYSVQITDINGCVDTASVIITVMPNITDLIIPNLITPNGDGFNDTWVIANIDTYPLNQIVVFNGYGQIIFESTGYNNDWDATYSGGNVPDGTYYYLIRLNDPNAIEEDIQGVLTILGNE